MELKQGNILQLLAKVKLLLIVLNGIETTLLQTSTDSVYLLLIVLNGIET